jgi:fatty acid-binding protein DegV
MAVRVVTDSAADLDAEQAASLGVRVVPLTIRFGSEEYVDRQDLSPAEFYAKLAASSTLPETAAPSPGAFDATFRSLFDEGADAIVCINLSSALSATMQSAQNAARNLEGRDIRIIDSRNATSGVGSQVVAAATAANAGASVDEIVDTLENLKKGGRIGNAQAMVGTLLSIKPMITVVDGVVEEAGKARTRSKALKALADKVLEAGEIENLSVMHGLAPDLDDFLALLAPKYPRESIYIGEIGATIGVHAGPRVMGVTFQVKHP